MKTSSLREKLIIFFQTVKTDERNDDEDWSANAMADVVEGLVRDILPPKITKDTVFEPPRQGITMIYKTGMAARAYNAALDEITERLK